MDFFFIFQGSTCNLEEKKQKHALRKFFVHPIQLTRFTYSGIIFRTMYILIDMYKILKGIGKNLYQSKQFW